jgi:hypothetical protein
MSVESKIITALSATGLPVQQDVYTGTATTYITFEYWTDPIWHRDDVPEYEQVNIRLHLYAPLTTNLTTIKGQIKTGLTAGGYAYPGTLNLTDENGRHIVFDTQIREAI